jgi:cytochrome c553
MSRIRSIALPLLATTGFAVLSTAHAGGDIERGRERSQVCQACHGQDGNGAGDPQYPMIAGQYADYLAQAMRAYKTGERQNLVMQGFMDTLTDQDIEDLAAYYSQQAGRLDDLSHLK